MNFRVVLASLALTFPMIAQAQSTDPVDKNHSSPYAGLLLNLGQAHAVSPDSDNGTAYLIGADVGYILARDTWNRIELGLELSTGKSEFSVDSEVLGQKVNTDVDVNYGLIAMLKAGYGYSLGDHAFGIFRVGFGIANGEAKAKTAGFSGTNDFDGTVAMLGYDVVFPASDTLDFVIGANYRIYNLDSDTDDGSDGKFQLNTTAVTAAARFRF